MGAQSGSVPELVGPSLERICEAASGRKFTKLRHEAKVYTAPALLAVFTPPILWLFTGGCVAANAYKPGGGLQGTDCRSSSSA